MGRYAIQSHPMGFTQFPLWISGLPQIYHKPWSHHGDPIVIWRWNQWATLDPIASHWITVGHYGISWFTIGSPWEIFVRVWLQKTQHCKAFQVYADLAVGPFSVLRVGYKTMLQAERPEFCVCVCVCVCVRARAHIYHLWHSGIRSFQKKSTKVCQINLLRSI